MATHNRGTPGCRTKSDEGWVAGCKPRSEKREGEQVEARRESSWRRDRTRKMGRHLEMSFFNVEGISIDRERVRERERQIEAERQRERERGLLESSERGQRVRKRGGGRQRGNERQRGLVSVD